MDETAIGFNAKEVSDDLLSIRFAAYIVGMLLCSIVRGDVQRVSFTENAQPRSATKDAQQKSGLEGVQRVFIFPNAMIVVKKILLL